MLIITVDVQLDTNKDEFLSLEELTADSEKEWTEEETEEMKRIDTDEDELLSRDELFSYISKELDDRDNTEEIDGEISENILSSKETNHEITLQDEMKKEQENEERKENSNISLDVLRK